MTKRKLSSAFTLIELLTVIAIIVILAGLLIPTIKSAMTKAEVSKAQAAISSLATALRSYYTEYGHWPITYRTPAGAPIPPPSPYEDFLVDKYLVALLSGDDVGGDGPTYKTAGGPYRPYKDNYSGPPIQSATAVVEGNPRKIVFLEFKSKEIDGLGYFVDPWGKPYHFRLDVYYQNEIDYPFCCPGPTAPPSPWIPVTAGFLIWANGPDGQYDQGDQFASAPPLAVKTSALNKDNIKSW